MDMGSLLHQFLQQLINGISLGSIYALIALGYTMIYGILKLINFAHGDIYMLGAYFGFVLFVCTGDYFCHGWRGHCRYHYRTYCLPPDAQRTAYCHFNYRYRRFVFT